MDESQLDRLIDTAESACVKALMLYREAQPDADEGECWAEFEALSDAVREVRLCRDESDALRIKRRALELLRAQRDAVR
jgi:hypothetical protein